MSVETLPPAYLTLEPRERGTSLGISFQNYRMLARSALTITRELSATMGVYRVGSAGCALDIWVKNRCLTIQINSELKCLLLLLFEDLDSGEMPICILSVSDSQEDWKRLQQVAHRALR
jgi:hypothetical protein